MQIQETKKKAPLTMAELLIDVSRASILNAISDLEEAPRRIYDAQVGFIKTMHDYAVQEAELTVSALSNPELKNDLQRKAAVDYALTHDNILTQLNAGIVTNKAVLDRERNKLDAAKTIIRAMELLA